MHLRGSENAISRAVRKLDDLSEAALVLHHGSVILIEKASHSRRSILPVAEEDSAVDMISSPASTAAATFPKPDQSFDWASHSQSLADDERSQSAALTLQPAKSVEPALVEAVSLPLEQYRTGRFHIARIDTILQQPELLIYLFNTYELHAFLTAAIANPPQLLVQAKKDSKIEHAIAFLNNILGNQAITHTGEKFNSISLLADGMTDSQTYLEPGCDRSSVVSMQSLQKDMSDPPHFHTYVLPLTGATQLAGSTTDYVKELRLKAKELKTCLHVDADKVLLLGGSKDAIFSAIQYTNALATKSQARKLPVHIFDPIALHSAASVVPLAEYYEYRLALHPIVAKWLKGDFGSGCGWLAVRFGLLNVMQEEGALMLEGSRGAIEDSLTFLADLALNCSGVSVQSRWQDKSAKYVQLRQPAPPIKPNQSEHSIPPAKSTGASSASSRTPSDLVEQSSLPQGPRSTMPHLQSRPSAFFPVGEPSSVRTAPPPRGPASHRQTLTPAAFMLPVTNDTLYRYVFPLKKEQVERFKANSGAVGQLRRESKLCMLGLLV